MKFHDLLIISGVIIVVFGLFVLYAYWLEPTGGYRKNSHTILETNITLEGCETKTITTWQPQDKNKNKIDYYVVFFYNFSP